MISTPHSFEFIEKKVRKKIFGVLSTIDSRNRPHSTGMVYAVSPQDAPFAFYMITGKNTVKAQNIQKNPAASLVVTFPHYYIRFAPSFYAMFRGCADILSPDDEIFRKAYSQKRLTRRFLDTYTISIENERVIRLRPEPIIFCFGVGISPIKIVRNPGRGAYKVKIPAERL